MDKVEYALSLFAAEPIYGWPDTFRDAIVNLKLWETEKLCFRLINIEPYLKLNHNRLYILVELLNSYINLGSNAYRIMVIYSIIQSHHMYTYYFIEYHRRHIENPMYINQFKSLTFRDLVL